MVLWFCSDEGMGRGRGNVWEVWVSSADLTQKPLFRTTTGFIPPSVWSSDFGKDRAQLIGHPIQPEKLQAKIPDNLSLLDMHLSMLEPMFTSGTWAMPTQTPSLADLSLYYQLRWGIDIGAGRGIGDLSGGGARDTDGEEDVVGLVFNKERYPGLMRWFGAFERSIDGLPDTQVTVKEGDMRWKEALRRTPLLGDGELLVPTAVAPHEALDTRRGMVPGVGVSVVPDDTGRGNPTKGTLVKIGSEEVVIKPHEKAELDVRIHFPRLGFIVKVAKESKM